MSTNPNTKTYWRRVSRMACELAIKISSKYNDKSVTDILTAKDPKATRTMHCEAIMMAIEQCDQSERSCRDEADQYRMAGETLREFRDPISLRVTPLRMIDGGKS